MWHYWLIAAGLFCIAEIIIPGFLVFWLAIGALVAMVVSFFTSNLIIQMTVFIIVSTILIFATKPLVKKFVRNYDKSVKTNVYSIIGKHAIVTKSINSKRELGQIKVDGEIWSAECENSSSIEQGTEVEIVKINGVKAIVKPISVN